MGKTIWKRWTNDVMSLKPDYMRCIIRIRGQGIEVYHWTENCHVMIEQSIPKE